MNSNLGEKDSSHAAGHIAPTVQKWREMNAGAQVTSPCGGPQDLGCPPIVWVFPLQLTYSTQSLTVPEAKTPHRCA